MGELHTIASNGNLTVIKKALKKDIGAFLATDEELGWSPLHYAANKSKTKIVEAILEAGVDPNIASVPPAKYIQNSWNLAMELDEDKADPIVYPLDVADGPSRTTIFKTILMYGGTFYGDTLTLHQAVQLDDMEEVEGLLQDESLRINARDNRGWMAIHYAVDLGNMEMVKVLIANKANINGSTYAKDATMHFNAWEIANLKNDEVMLKFLESKGAKRHPGIQQNQRASLKSQTKLYNTSKSDLDMSAVRAKLKEREASFNKVPKAPEGFLGKLFENKHDKEKRLALEALAEKEREKAAQAKKEKEAELERKRRQQQVIKWSNGEDPFKLKGESITYDQQCEAHVYFMDIVGYSKKSTSEQKEVTDQLVNIVKSTESFQKANKKGKLVILPTGDGMALVFFDSIHTAFKCAIDVGKRTFKHAQIGLRHGVYTGPVVPVKDINDNPNVSGTAINMAQRCMDAGDNDHILISDHVYQYVRESLPGLQFEDWGPVVVKHGATVHMWTAFGPTVGRKEFPHWRGVKRLECKEDENSD